MKRTLANAFVVAFLTLALASPLSAQATPTPPQPAPVTVPSILEFFGIEIQEVPADVDPKELENFYRSVWGLVGHRYYDESKLVDWHKWEHAYDGKLRTLDDLDKALTAMVSSLNDKWTWYLSPSAKKLNREKAANGIVSSGIGLKASPDGSYVVENIRAGSAAYVSALRIGDTVTALNGKTLNGMPMSEVEPLLEGKAGTTLQINYKSGGIAQELSLTLTPLQRGQSEALLLSDGVLYLRLPGFSKTDVDNLEMAVGALAKKPGFSFEYIVLDLRGNSGGDVDMAIHVVETFMAKGTIMTYDERNGRIAQTVTKKVRPFLTHQLKALPEAAVCRTDALHNKPMAVLINGSTASSAEIVAAALGDNERATVMGATSWGKAVAWTGLSLDNGGALSLTVSGIKSPSGFDWMGKGLTPRVVIEQPRNASIDVQLLTAIDTLKKQVKK